MSTSKRGAYERRQLASFAYSHSPRRGGIDGQISNLVQAVQQVNHDSQYKNSHAEPKRHGWRCAESASGCSRRSHPSRAPGARHSAYEFARKRERRRAGRKEWPRSESPGRVSIAVPVKAIWVRLAFMGATFSDRYFSALRLRVGCALISFRRWLALESRSKS